MRNTLLGCSFIAIAASVLVHPIARAEGPGEDVKNSEARAADALKLTREIARAVQMYGGEDRATKLQLVDSPVQQFSNPIAGEFYAQLFIWTNNGRPAAAASILKWYAPRQNLQVELQSLAERPISAEYKQNAFWHPETAGLKFVALSESIPPAGVASQRLRQMRQLARTFHVRIKAVNRGGNIDEELRLLAQPIYRYKSEPLGVQDGAIFSFVRGTDPELLLLIEASAASGEVKW